MFRKKWRKYSFSKKTRSSGCEGKRENPTMQDFSIHSFIHSFGERVAIDFGKGNVSWMEDFQLVYQKVDFDLTNQASAYFLRSF